MYLIQLNRFKDGLRSELNGKQKTVVQLISKKKPVRKLGPNWESLRSRDLSRLKIDGLNALNSCSK